MLRARPWRRPVAARKHSEGHRQASWLELFFDLSFVVAVAQAAIQLEHALAAGHVGDGLVGYLIVFAAIWWAWMAFTWFANVFDTDDVPYRLLMMVMIAGCLGLAAGVPKIAELDFRIGVLSYVVMRLAYVAQWLRVLRTRDPAWMPIAVKMSVLTTINQIGWVVFLFIPFEHRVPVFAVWFAVELATPLIAGWDARMGGHKGHIVERYGLFTIIVLGESVAAATVAVGQAIEARASVAPLLTLGFGGLVTVFSLWWIYFDFSSGRAPGLGRTSQFVWGYGHYFLFASIAAIGAGLALSVDWITDQEQIALPERGLASVVGAGVAAFLLTLGFVEWLAEQNFRAWHALLKAGGAGGALVAAWAAPILSVPGSVLVIGIVLAALVACGVVVEDRMYLRTSGAE